MLVQWIESAQLIIFASIKNVLKNILLAKHATQTNSAKILYIAVLLVSKKNANEEES